MVAASEVLDRLSNEELNKQVIYQAYVKIQREHEIETEFHSLSIPLQRFVVEFLNRAGKLDSVMTLASFMHRNNYDRRTISAWSHIDSSNRPNLYNGPGGVPSAELVVKIGEFKDVLKDHDFAIGKYDSYSSAMVFFFLMRTVHGEDLVMEMLDHWMVNIEHFTYSRFEKFAECWEGVKDLPIAWALNIAEAK